MIRKLSAVLGLAAVFAAPGANAEVTIGVSLALTGGTASLGIPYKNAFQLLPKTLGGEPVKVHHPGRRKQTGQCGKERPEIRYRGQGRCHDGLGPAWPSTMAMVQVAG